MDPLLHPDVIVQMFLYELLRQQRSLSSKVRPRSCGHASPTAPVSASGRQSPTSSCVNSAGPQGWAVSVYLPPDLVSVGDILTNLRAHANPTLHSGF